MAFNKMKALVVIFLAILFLSIRANAEVLYATDFSGFSDGPLAGQDPWTEISLGEGAKGSTTVDVSNGAVMIAGEGPSAAGVRFAPQQEAYYGFDMRVDTAPTGGSRAIAKLLASTFSRCSLNLSSTARQPGEFGMMVSPSSGGMPSDFDFGTGSTIRVVVGCLSGNPPSIWVLPETGEGTGDIQPVYTAEQPSRGPFEGFAIVPQSGFVEIDNLVVATSFEEAANRELAAQPGP